MIGALLMINYSFLEYITSLRNSSKDLLLNPMKNTKKSFNKNIEKIVIKLKFCFDLRFGKRVVKWAAVRPSAKGRPAEHILCMY